MRRIFLTCSHACFGVFFLIATLEAADNKLAPVPTPVTQGGGYDANGFLLNPQWRCQAVGGGECGDKTEIPDAEHLCDGKPRKIKKECTTDYAIDRPGGLILGLCKGFNRHSKLNGHLNLLPAATATGCVQWYRHDFLDGDYNFLLKTGDDRMLTKQNVKELGGGMKIEFDSRETLNKLNLDGWWAKFYEAAYQRYPRQPVVDLVGESQRAVAIGVLGLDCEHGCATEIHPAYAVAFRLPGSAKLKERWVLMARNSGNEGICSSHRQHAILPEGGPLRLLIPKNADDLAKPPETIYFARHAEQDPEIAFVPGRGLLVTFHLPAARRREVFVAEVNVEWAGVSAEPEPCGSPVLVGESSGEPELDELEERPSPMRNLNGAVGRKMRWNGTLSAAQFDALRRPSAADSAIISNNAEQSSTEVRVMSAMCCRPRAEIPTAARESCERFSRRGGCRR